MSPAVLCEGDFSACFPLCFMSDSLCRMLMVISELRRQMKTQLKERKMRLRSSLSSIYCYYQFPSQRQIRALLSVAGRGTHRNSFTETQPHHKPHERRVYVTCLAKPPCGREPLQSHLHGVISDFILLFNYLSSCWRKSHNMVSRVSGAYRSPLHPLTKSKLQPLTATTTTGKACLMSATPQSLCGAITVELMLQYFCSQSAPNILFELPPGNLWGIWLNLVNGFKSVWERETSSMISLVSFSSEIWLKNNTLKKKSLITSENIVSHLQLLESKITSIFF